MNKIYISEGIEDLIGHHNPLYDVWNALPDAAEFARWARDYAEATDQLCSDEATEVVNDLDADELERLRQRIAEAHTFAIYPAGSGNLQAAICACNEACALWQHLADVGYSRSDIEHVGNESEADFVVYLASRVHGLDGERRSPDPAPYACGKYFTIKQAASCTARNDGSLYGGPR